MLNPTFLKNKINRQINQNGQEFLFKRHSLDRYHQVSDEIDFEYTINGIFHTTNSYVKKSSTDGARISSKQQPMILTIYEEGIGVEENDEVTINNITYVVAHKTNINAFDAAFDISLEEKENGEEF